MSVRGAPTILKKKRQGERKQTTGRHQSKRVCGDETQVQQGWEKHKKKKTQTPTDERTSRQQREKQYFGSLIPLPHTNSERQVDVHEINDRYRLGANTRINREPIPPGVGMHEKRRTCGKNNKLEDTARVRLT